MSLLNSGQFGPALALVGAAYAGCNPAVTVALLTLGVGLNGGIYSGFKVNHLDLSPSLAGVLMSITNCSANMAGLLAPLVAGHVTHNRVRIIFAQTDLS
jgi:MFS transporter, ACS family, solute carrier family 17 (sodium-dependent inorganic phosphate cotransporter), member 5